MKPRNFQYMADISSNNGSVNIANYSRAGHVVIMIKATQGHTYVNPFYEIQANQAHEYGLTVVHYHYCENGPINAELEHFRAHYTPCWRNGDYPEFDIEEGQSKKYAHDLILDYYTKTHREPTIYCNRSTWENRYRGLIIPGKRLHIADYSSNPVNVNPYTLWARQYTDGEEGPEPHFFTGIGKCDGSIVSFGPAAALAIRKIRTRKRS